MAGPLPAAPDENLPRVLLRFLVRRVASVTDATNVTSQFLGSMFSSAQLVMAWKGHGKIVFSLAQLTGRKR